MPYHLHSTTFAARPSRLDFKTHSISTSNLDKMPMDAQDEGVFGYASSASASTSMSPGEVRNCFCGNIIGNGEGIYCSAGCARSDAFSTLCNRPNPSLASSIALGSSSINTSTDTDASTNDNGSEDWESHYGRMCRADLRREERKEERRRRRAEGSGSMSGSTSTRSTIMSTSSSSSRLPDLVGGHSRNASTASSRTSYSSNGGLSRNPSVASSSTSRRGYGFNVDTPIMEDDDEAEWLASEAPTGYGLPHPFECHLPPTIRMPVPTIRGQPTGVPQSKRRPSHSHSHSNSRSLKKKLEPFGMGQDMRDVLEEIISMEKEFIIDSSDEASTHGYQSDTQNQPVFTAVFDRPPRTPSPGMDPNRRSLAPGAPARGHRKSMSMANPPEVQAGPMPNHPPPFVYGHSASLSESHTALYLATASPEAEPAARSASPPKMKARNSMSFTPEAAGPIIAGNPAWLGSDLTPSRRRPGHSPSAHHPTMSGWKFPNYANFNSNPNSQSNMATPTKLTIDTAALGNLRTPTSTSQRPHPNTRPQLLWPPNAPGLAPSHFPSSAGSRNSIISVNMDAPEPADQLVSSPTVQTGQRPQRQRRRQAPIPREVTPPNSGLRLGVLLGSGSGSGEEGGMDLDEGSPVLGGGQYVNQHGFGYGFGMGRPVYLSPAPPE